MNELKTTENVMNEVALDKVLVTALDIDKDITGAEKLANVKEYDKLSEKILADNDLSMKEKTELFYKNEEKRREALADGIEKADSIRNSRIKNILSFTGGVIALGGMCWVYKNPEMAKTFLNDHLIRKNS